MEDYPELNRLSPAMEVGITLVLLPIVLVMLLVCGAVWLVLSAWDALRR